MRAGTYPEPCLNGRCYSPVACGGFGYCRERNASGMPSAAQADRYRSEAVVSRAVDALSDEPPTKKTLRNVTMIIALSSVLAVAAFWALLALKRGLGL